MVSAAVAGDDLQSVARSSAAALGRSVAIALPSLGAPVVWPPHSASPEDLAAIVAHAAAVIEDSRDAPPAALADCVAIRIGQEVAGIVAALGGERFSADQRPWLEAAAAAAAVAALMRESQSGDLAQARRELVEALLAAPVGDPAALVSQARRLGVELAHGAAGVCAQGDGGPLEALPEPPRALLAELGRGRVAGLVPLADGPHAPAIVAAELEAGGLRVALSAPRRSPAALHEALREAELLAELASHPDAMLAGQEETYRLLIGVFLRDPLELSELRDGTISPLAVYDARHDTDLLATLQAFLAHHGSTTDTADALGLHRHTVGYRLARVHEVSGLSPYESDGRERLSLGLKAHRILEAGRRRAGG